MIDGKLPEREFFAWHVAEVDKRRRRLLFLRQLAEKNNEPFTPEEQKMFDEIREGINEESILETSYFDQISAAWKDIEAQR